MSSATKPFPFLELPPEIREKIYILICHQSAPISLHIPISTPCETSSDPSFPHALLQTCTLIYNELRPIYFTHNTFTLSIRRRNDDLTYFLSPSFLDNRRQIRSLKLIIYRFGGHDFFTKDFIPVLEDCIMNGRLRDLDVVVKERFLRSVKLCERGLRGGFRDTAGLETLRDWVALRRVLLDPYLEKRLLRSGNLDAVDSVNQENIELTLMGVPGYEEHPDYQLESYHP
ncbi:uncharacterized protein LY89DRAFT_776474 [Mollisia scopiformis]|uniref:Uncharacterized protein n=1 Tax=Mollisia scopiformis TaxID=149040 RepID=A0A194XWE1_MOLSC|nr:uncharacterized protein LY89DRAFT_776474 [Mollisia scopiformis]KUJ24339.1 hypothetical protein LY89DRAFT_776474 [Mollisia scopiformis]